MIDRLMRATWTALPKELKRTAKNLAVIRFGTIAYLALVLGAFASAARNLDPVGFVAWAASLDSLLGVVGLAGAVAIMFGRAMQTAPRFVAAYAVMLPDHAHAIETAYAERGLADVAAPWITSNGAFARVASRLGRRFRIVP